jgi:malic enzyme
MNTLNPGLSNLEDIFQPNCYKVLDVLREECDIPVRHDDAQGTAGVTHGFTASGRSARLRILNASR